MTLPEPPEPKTEITYQQKWVRITAPHFVIVTDAGEQAGRDLALYLEQIRSVFGQLLLNGKPPQGAPLQVLAFANHEALAPFALKMDRDRPTTAMVLDSGDIFAGDATSERDIAPGENRVGEIYLRENDEDFAVLNLSSPRPWRVFLHSYTHHLLDANLPPLPRWFVEGFAQYMSVIRVEKEEPEGEQAKKKKKDKNGVEPPPVYHAISGFSSHPASDEQFSIVSLFGAADSISQADHALNSRIYATAWREVEFLVATNKLQQALDCFVLVRQKVPLQQAVEQAFGVPAAELDAQAADYFRGRPAKRLLVPSEAAGIVAGPVSELERRLLFADIHLHEPGYHRVGAKELQDILRDAPATAAAHRAMALDDVRNHHPELALRQLAVAEEQDPNDWLAHYYHAQILRTNNPPGPLPELEHQARELIRTNPEFADGYAILGSVLGLEARNAEGALAYEQALRLNPSSEVYAVNLAMLYCASDRCNQAKPIFAELVSSKDARIAGTAEGYLKGLGK